MTNIPEKCLRCGAPISWKEGSSSVECEFCGNNNFLKKHNFNISKDNVIYPIKNFLINKKILNKNQIDYINQKSRKLFEKRFFRFFILIIFISTPLILIKENTINPKLKTLCDEISKKEKTSFAASKTYRNCMKKIKGLNSRIRSQRINDIKKQCKNINEFQKFHLKLLNKESLDYSWRDTFEYKDPTLTYDKEIGRWYKDARKSQDWQAKSEAERLIKEYENFGYYIRKLEKLARPSGIFTSKEEEKGISYDFNSCKEELLNNFVYEGDKINYIFINKNNNWWEDL